MGGAGDWDGSDLALYVKGRWSTAVTDAGHGAGNDCARWRMRLDHYLGLA